MSQRVVVTGMGTISPVGNDVATFWDRIRSGTSGLGPITRFDPSAYTAQIAGEVKDFNASDYMERRDASRTELFAQYAIAASREAISDAGLTADALDSERVGVILGVGFGGIDAVQQGFEKLFERGAKGVHPFFVPRMMGNAAAAHVAIQVDAHGPCTTTVSACASANDAIGNALRTIRAGGADVVITGGSEGMVSPVCVAGFSALQALTTSHNDEPTRASRPFARDRDGFVLGEGAGILVLESLEHAGKRGAEIYGEVIGYGATCDANHLTAPHPEGLGAIRAMRMALRSGGLEPDAIDYVNAHGTSTPLNDPTESRAIRQVFGDHANDIAVSSTKSMTGHLLGAAGGIEAIATVLALRDGFLPPTINLDEPDPACDLDYVANEGRKAAIETAMSNTFGFGGHNAVLCFARFQD